MSLEERAKAAAKNLEGKLQETVGEVTGDRRQQTAGQAKQAEADLRNAKEDAKDALKRNLDRI